MLTAAKFAISRTSHALLSGLLVSCFLQASTAAPLGDIRSRVTIERDYEFGTEIKLVVKKGEVVRLTLNENPSSRKEIFLLPRDTYLQWFIPSKWGVEQAQAAGGSYSVRYHLNRVFFNSLLYVKLLETPNDTITISLVMDRKKDFPRLVERQRERLLHRRKLKEEEKILD